MSSKIRKIERDKANYQYFRSLADSRASLSRLPMMAFLTSILLSLTLLWLGSWAFYGGYPELTSLFYVQIAVIGFSLVVLVATTLQGWVYRYQVLSSSFMVFFAVVGWVYACCLLAIGMATVDIGWSGSTEFSSTLLDIAGIVAPLYVLGATIVHVMLLRKRLREGYSEKRTMGNYLAASSVFSSKSLWIIFAVAILAPNLLTAGRYALVTLGTLMFLFLASVATSLPVEFGYLAYLKSRDKKYWESRPPKRVMTRRQRNASWKKVGTWTLVILVVIAVIAVLNELLPEIL